jgi:hypothetical protein
MPIPSDDSDSKTSPGIRVEVAEPVIDDFSIDIAESSAVHPVAPGITHRGTASPAPSVAIPPALAYTAQMQAEIEKARASGMDREPTNIYQLDKLAKSEAKAAVAEFEEDVGRRLDGAQNEGDVIQALLRYFGDTLGRVLLLEKNGERLIGIQGRLLAWPANRMHDLDFPADVFPKKSVDWMAIPPAPVWSKLSDALGHVEGMLVTTVNPRKGKPWVICAESPRVDSPPRSVVQISARAADALSRVRF